MDKKNITGKTESGFKFSIDSRVLNDWNFVEAVALTESENSADQLKGMVSVVTLMLGKNGIDSLKSHIAKNNDGFVPMDEISKEIVEMIEQAKAKN